MRCPITIEREKIGNSEELQKLREKHRHMPLLEALKDYSNQEITPFDVPGHKRGNGAPILVDYFGTDVLKMDVNSLPLLDNAAHPTGVILQAQKLLAQAYEADEAFFITNGTTSAIHSMLLSVLKPGDKVLLPRNIHKSAINGLILCGAIPIYIDSPISKEGIVKNVLIDSVVNLLETTSDIQAIFLLNPTYYGFSCELKEIVKKCHEKGILVLVDEAHGAHFPFHSNLPYSAMACDADISCVSLHKTGGALTQASAMLVNTKRIDIKKVRKAVNLLQSTSCSYLLMSSLDAARSYLILEGEKKLDEIIRLSQYARTKLNNIPGISTIEPLKSEQPYFDVTKLGINVSGLGLNGFLVYEIMWKEFNIQLEMPDFNHVLAILSLGDGIKEIDRLIQAFEKLSNQFYGSAKKIMDLRLDYVQPNVQMSPRDAHYAQKELVVMHEAIGRLCGESILTYPPGIPIVAPGEVITSSVIACIKQSIRMGAFMTDNDDESLKKILVIK